MPTAGGGSEDAAVVTRKKADFSSLWLDAELSDFTLKIKIAKAAAAAQLGQQPPQPPQQQVVAPAAAGDGEAVTASVAAAGQKGQPQAAADDEVATVPVHGAVLSQRSAYFDRLVRTEMKERRTKVVVFELEDEQEAADFQRLIKLSYTPTYTEEDGRALNKEELLRLLVLANGYGMEWCLEECSAALRPIGSYTMAMAYFRTLPEGLMEDKRMHATTQEAGDAVAMELGPVETLWRPGEVYVADDWGATWLLKEDVKALPLPAMEAVLRSEKLQLKSENYAFTLALWWTLAQPGAAAEQHLLLKRLLKSLHYTRMSCAFLAAIVQLPGVRDSGLVPAILTRAFWWRDVPLRELWAQLPRSRVNGAVRKSYSVVFATHFNQAEVELLQQPGDEALAPLGMLHGVPLRLQLLMRTNGIYSLSILSSFLQEDATFALADGPPWMDPGGDGERGFKWTIVTGYLGTVALEPDQIYLTRVKRSFSDALPDGAILLCTAEAFAYVDGKQKVELELQVAQHRGC